MPKITLDKIKKAYTEAKLVYIGQKSQSASQDDLESIGLNKNSAGDFIVNFRCMMNGQRFTRTNNAETTRYYLENIYNEFGEEKLANALNALKAHIEYYEKLRNITMHKTRKIYQEFLSELNNGKNIVYPDEVEKNLIEGAKKEVVVNAYERNIEARKKCIEYYGYQCKICGFDFEKTYGEIGKDFIHIHHIVPLSQIDQEYIIDPIKDLIPVCPNCHAMLHKKNPPFTIDELQKILKLRR